MKLSEISISYADPQKTPSPIFKTENYNSMMSILLDEGEIILFNINSFLKTFNIFLGVTKSQKEMVTFKMKRIKNCKQMIFSMNSISIPFENINSDSLILKVTSENKLKERDIKEIKKSCSKIQFKK